MSKSAKEHREYIARLEAEAESLRIAQRRGRTAFLVAAIVVGALIWMAASAQQATNFTALVIRDVASFATDPPPRAPTREERLLADAVRLIDLGRKALDPSIPPAQRAVFARQYLDQTDPVVRPVDLGATPP